MNKKLSIIIPNYNNEIYLNKSLNSLINQTYKNLEIIVVNDGSKGNCDEIINKYLKKDSRIKYIKHDVNKGLFQARLTGADIATGDYIAFLDADDYVSIDFYRPLIENAIEKNADIIIGNTVLEYDNGSRIEYPLANLNLKMVRNGTCLDRYFDQEGLNFFWHTVWNKIYSMSLWKQARKHYSNISNKLIMTEDFAFSTVLFYYANNVITVDNDCIFYCQHENSSTSVSKFTYDKCLKNINDLKTSFNFIEDFLKEQNIYNKYNNNFKNWKRLYANMHRNYIEKSSKISKKQKKELLELMNSYSSEKKLVKYDDYFTKINNPWNSTLETIKKLIKNENIKVISFDIFDTLLLRPFFCPTDLFKFLDKEYRQYNKNGVDFATIRMTSEIEARNRLYKLNPNIEEITLDVIYEIIGERYKINKDILEKIKQKEIELEIRFCKKRETFYNIYNLAKFLNKKIIFTSDMYLPENVVKKILEDCGYDSYYKLYLSSNIKKTKFTSNLYKYLIKDLNVLPEQILHIGDNYEADYLNPKKLGIKSFHILKPIDIFMNKEKTNCLSQMFDSNLPFWYDNKESCSFFGIRTMLAVVANKYFDNPFRTFNLATDFNSDPYLIGYYAIGMYLFGVSNWILKNTSSKNDIISFMARDGYLIMEAYKIMKQIYKDVPDENYLYVSRKALLPIIVENDLDLYKLNEFIDINVQTPKKLINYLSDIIIIDEKRLEKLCLENNLKFNKPFKDIQNFNIFIKILIDNFYDESYLKNRRKIMAKYFSDQLGNNPAVFDVGYSARPEYYLTKLINKKIDTYFLNINSDIALNYSRLGEFDLYTYFDAKPTLTGFAYELLISKQEGSCISYNITQNKVIPILEKYKESYQSRFAINTMQKASLEFVQDMVSIFFYDIDILYYQNYYINLPFLGYLNSANSYDKLPLYPIEFEDDLGLGDNVKMIDIMQEHLDEKNQLYFNELIETNGNLKKGNKKVGDLYYNPYVDLNKRKKPKRILYYYLFDKETFKRRLKEILKLKRGDENEKDI